MKQGRIFIQVYAKRPEEKKISSQDEFQFFFFFVRKENLRKIKIGRHQSHKISRDQQRE